MKIETYYLYAIYVFLLIVQYILIPKFLPLAKEKQFFPRDRTFFFAMSKGLLIVFCIWITTSPKPLYFYSGYVMLALEFIICWFRCNEMIEDGEI